MLCIAILTCPRYSALADYAEKIIDSLWQPHPPVYLCGTGRAATGSVIELRDNPSDWMSVTCSAMKDLNAKGYSQVYLILEDHPPVAGCNSGHLNVTLPEFMNRTNAVHIGLQGWEKLGHRPLIGQLDNASGIEKVPSDFEWRFSLHPSLWDLKSLIDLLDRLIDDLPPEMRTPWKFERLCGAPDNKYTKQMENRSYRVSGWRMSASPFGRVLYRFSELAVLQLRHLATQLSGNEKSWAELNQKLQYILNYYEGPYPLIWSGILQKGKINGDYIRYMEYRGWNRYVSDVKKIAETM